MIVIQNTTITDALGGFFSVGLGGELNVVDVLIKDSHFTDISYSIIDMFNSAGSLQIEGTTMSGGKYNPFFGIVLWSSFATTSVNVRNSTISSVGSQAINVNQPMANFTISGLDINDSGNGIRQFMAQLYFIHFFH